MVDKNYTIKISESERKLLILFLRHIWECPVLDNGKGIRPMAFMMCNKLFGRGYREGDWEKHITKTIKEKIAEFEPMWEYLRKRGKNGKERKNTKKV